MYFLLALTAAQIGYVATGVYANPYATGDAYAIWYLKASAMRQGVYPMISYSHPEYPLLFPLVLAILSDNERIYMWLAPLIFVTIIFVSYHLVKERSSVFWGTVAAFAVSSVMVLERLGGRGEVGFADLPLALAFLTAFYFCLKKNVNYPLVGLIWGLAANIKMEGLLGSILFCLIFRPRNKNFWLVFLPLALWWPLTTRLWGLGTIYESGVGLFDWQRLPAIMTFWAKSVTDFGRFSLWPAIGALALFVRQNKFKMRRVQVWIFSFLGLIALSYLVTPLDLGAHWGSSYYRIIVQVLPLMISMAVYLASLLMA